MILLLHHIQFIIYKRVLSSASLNTPSNLKGGREEKLRTGSMKN